MPDLLYGNPEANAEWALVYWESETVFSDKGCRTKTVAKQGKFMKMPAAFPTITIPGRTSESR
jgi:hypothetical protein